MLKRQIVEKTLKKIFNSKKNHRFAKIFIAKLIGFFKRIKNIQINRSYYEKDLSTLQKKKKK